MQQSEKKFLKHSGYAPVNGLSLYYEIYGEGEPLVLIHGGGSTIYSSFGKLLDSFAENYKVIAVELQAHGHTADIDRETTFENDADDVAELMKYLKIGSASFLGFSNGANTTMQIAMRHPALVKKIIVCSGFYKKAGMQPGFWEWMAQGTIDNMPQILKDDYRKINPDPAALQKMFDRDHKRMMGFKDWTDEIMRSIEAPTLIVAGDQDVTTPEHTLEMFRIIPHARLLMLPGGHGEYLGEIMSTKPASKIPALFVAAVEDFLNE